MIINFCVPTCIFVLLLFQKLVEETLKVGQLDRFSEKVDLLGRDIFTLSPGQELNDEIVNNYLMMIEERGRTAGSKYPSVFSFSTFFYSKLVKQGPESVGSCKRKQNLFKHDLLLIPVNVNGNHWILVVVDLRDATVWYYDSMRFNGYVICFIFKRRLMLFGRFVSGFRIYYYFKCFKKYFTNCVFNVIACCNL